MGVRAGPERWQSAEELMLSNCGAGEDSWESLGSKETKSIHPKGSQPWVFIGRTDSEAEAPILWPPDVKRQLTGKAPDARKERLGAGEDGMVEDKMVGRPDWLNGHELEKTLGDSEWQGGLWATVHGATKSGTRFNDWTTTRLQTASTQAIYTCLQLQLPALFTLLLTSSFSSAQPFWHQGLGL